MLDLEALCTIDMSNRSLIHVLHVIDKLSMDGTNPSSVALLLQNWIPRFEQQSVVTSICCLKNPDPGAAWIQEQGIRVFSVDEGKYSWKNVQKIAQTINIAKAQIIHLHGYRAANFGRIAVVRSNVKAIVHEHAILPILPHQWIADWLLRNYTDVAVAVSQTVKEFMIRGRHVPARKIRVIGNGVNVVEYEKRSPEFIQHKKEELGISPGTRIIGTVTRLRKEKGTEYLIQAIPDIVKKCSNVLVLVIGDGPEKRQLEALAEEYQVSPYLRFLGFRSDVKDLLSLFDVNVIPSLCEGYCLALVEAMAAGNAIVASEVGGMRELAKHEESVLFVPPQDPKAISQSVVRLLENSLLARQLSDTAKSNSQKYDMKESANTFIALYQELIMAV